MTFLGPEPHPSAKQGAANHQELLPRMFWDSQSEPAVEAPLGDFFAAGFGMRLPVNSLRVQVEGGASYNSFWPMPFRRSARARPTRRPARLQETQSSLDRLLARAGFSTPARAPPTGGPVRLGSGQGLAG